MANNRRSMNLSLERCGINLKLKTLLKMLYWVRVTSILEPILFTNDSKDIEVLYR